MDTMRLRFRDLAWDSPRPGIRVKTVVQGDQQIRLIEFGADFPEEAWCTSAHTGIVLEGSLTLEFAHGFEVFETGDGIQLAAGEASRHRPHASGEPSVLFLVEPAPD